MVSIAGYLLSGLALGFILAWLIQKSKIAEKMEKLKIENAEMKKDLNTNEEKIKWLQSAEENLKETFKALSSDILNSNSDRFLKQAKDKVNELLKLQKKDWGIQQESFKGLVEPLNKNLADLDKQVQEMEKSRAGAYEGLIEKIVKLNENYHELNTTTINLTQALKSSTVRGRWGEVQLRRVVEMAGMVSHVDFEEQVSTEEGRPDMVVYLPNEGIIPVDSKAPMGAFLDVEELSDEEQKQKKLEEHAKAMRSHMKSLSQKAYWSQFDVSPEFVVMVVPNDPALTAAFERDKSLLEDALNNKVLIVSPISLLALLKVIAYGWLQLQLAESAQEIAKEGKTLYDRFLIFGGHLSDVGKRLNSTVQSYNKSIGSMESRISPSLTRLKEMGAGSDDLVAIKRVESSARILQGEVDNDEE